MTRKQTEYWSSHCLHSTYGANNNKEFYTEVLDESWLRKCLIGTLYEIVEKPKEFIHTMKQLTINNMGGLKKWNILDLKQHLVLKSQQI